MNYFTFCVLDIFYYLFMCVPTFPKKTITKRTKEKEKNKLRVVWLPREQTINKPERIQLNWRVKEQ